MFPAHRRLARYQLQAEQDVGGAAFLQSWLISDKEECHPGQSSLQPPSWKAARNTDGTELGLFLSRMAMMLNIEDC